MAKRGRLGLWGWVWGGKHNIERVLYTLHRITGVALVFYLMVHIIVVGFRAFGENAWTKAMAAVGVGNPVVRILEYFLVIAVVFHATNGIRLVLGELGFGIGRPKRPIYPYPKESIRKPRKWILILEGMASVYLLIAVYFFFFSGHGG